MRSPKPPPRGRRQPHRTARRRPRRVSAGHGPRVRRRRRVALAIVALALIAGVVWLLVGSSLLATRQVEVAGTVELTEEEVRAAARVPIGTPLLLVDTARIESRVQQVRRVAGAQVSRSVPGTVSIQVTERTPIAVTPAGRDVHLVDAAATSYATVPDAPPGLPELRVPRVVPGAPTARAAVQVLTALPPQLRQRVRVVSASSPTGVVLRLHDGREVHWGGTAQSERKAAVLAPLLTRPGDVYDVSSPQLPTIS